jgi:signal transduction histidine kinase
VGEVLSDLSQNLESLQDSRGPYPAEAASSAARDTIDAPLREGLPATYRMRADAHYIDLLDATPVIPLQTVAVHAIETTDDVRDTPVPSLVDSIKRHGVLEPLLVQKRGRQYRLIAGRKRLAAALAAGSREVPCIVHAVSDDEARALAAATTLPVAAAVRAGRSSVESMNAELAQSLAAVLSCTELLSDGVPVLTREVAVDMIRAEAQRVSCMVQATRVFEGGVPADRRPVSPRDVIERVARIIAAECRLRGVALEISATAVDSMRLNVDADLLASALSGVVLMMSAALKRVVGAHLKITAAAESAERISLVVVQDGVVLPQAWLSPPERSDARSISDPLMPLLVLQQVAEAYGGRLLTSRLPRGSCVAVELPADT